jgi:hypothetical protein
MSCQISKCLVSDCKHNGDYSCKAESIEVRPVEDKKINSSTDTSCSTFELKS